MRSKLKLALIANNFSRKTTFKKRKTSIMKKVKELSTLCGIDACSIIYSPDDSIPDVWPSNSDVQRIISDFRSLPEVDQQKKMMDQETFLRERITKSSEHMKKERKKNREAEMTQVMFQCLDGKMRMFHLNLLDLNDLGYLIEHYIKNLDRRIDVLEHSGTEIGESSSAAAVAAHSEGLTLLPGVVAPPPVIHEVGSSSSSVVAPTFFNPIQHQGHHFHQQFRHPAAPQVGIYEQLWNMNHNQNQQQSFMETRRTPDQMSYAAEQMGFPVMDDNHHNPNHHHHHHNEPQQQHNTNDSSTAPAAFNSSSLVPVTNPDLTKNI